MTEWEKIFVNYIADKRLIFRMLGIQETPTNNPVRKWAKDMNRNFPKDEIQIAQQIH